MKNLKGKALYAMLAGVCLAGMTSYTVRAAEVLVTSDITTSTTWTADNVYRIQGQRYVEPGATLTIQAGTVIKDHAGTANFVITNTTTGAGVWTDVSAGDQGSLAVCRGAKIYVNGTATSPVIFTDDQDDFVHYVPGHTNGWGNLTLMGRGLISASNIGSNPRTYLEGTASGTTPTTNTKTPTGLNKAAMEGLVASPDGDPRVIYGGNNDDDDSGAIHFASFRYGGKVLGQGNELNGLSLGAIGRATQIDHVETFNSVDDGIEVWGGAVNLKYLVIWNPGDDGLDIDQGWRGKAQFGLIVQGYSAVAGRGSGVSDNCFEFDGAENPDAQPCSTIAIYNFTAVGQPSSGHSGMALRDNCNVQFRNCIWIEVGGVLLSEETDGDNAQSWTDPETGLKTGYGYGTTSSWHTRWTTAAMSGTNNFYAANWGSIPNSLAFTPGAFNDPAKMYQAQVDGNLLEVTDSIFYHCNYTKGTSNAFNNAGGSDVVGITGAGGWTGGAVNNSNVMVPAASASLPIQGLQRVDLSGTVSAPGGFIVFPVTQIDPRAANDALALANAAHAAPADGFFTPVTFRGAFSKDVNWALGWTAASAYGFFNTGGVGSATTPPTQASDPSGTMQIQATTIDFQTVGGVFYSIESSTDGKKWTPIKTVLGTGSTMTVGSQITVDPAKIYRAIAQ